MVYLCTNTQGDKWNKKKSPEAATLYVEAWYRYERHKVSGQRREHRHLFQ